jgi:hypothetical protein
MASSAFGTGTFLAEQWHEDEGMFRLDLAICNGQIRLTAARHAHVQDR